MNQIEFSSKKLEQLSTLLDNKTSQSQIEKQNIGSDPEKIGRSHGESLATTTFKLDKTNNNPDQFQYLLGFVSSYISKLSESFKNIDGEQPHNRILLNNLKSSTGLKDSVKQLDNALAA